MAMLRPRVPLIALLVQNISAPLITNTSTIYVPIVTAGVVYLLPSLLTNVSTIYPAGVFNELRLSPPFLKNNGGGGEKRSLFVC